MDEPILRHQKVQWERNRDTASRSHCTDSGLWKLCAFNSIRMLFDMDRLQMLKDLLAQDPNNQLARYGLAMEYSGKGEVDASVGEFKKLIEINPDYANAYFMAAQALAKADRAEEAKQLLRQGITAAARIGNSHAQGEMQGFLDELEF
jgi:tetratricopeptide (TPR) repeat protein